MKNQGRPHRFAKFSRLSRGAVPLSVLLIGVAAWTPGASASVPGPYLSATIAVGSLPIGIAVSPDGRSTWAVNNNGGGSGSVSRIDTATHTVTATVPVGNGPVGIAMSPNGSSAWVTNGTDGTISRISTAANRAVGLTISTGIGSSPYEVATTPNGRYLWVTNPPAGTVIEVDAASGAIVGSPVVVGLNPKGIAMSPDGRRVWVAVFGSNTVVGIDTATRSVASTVSVGTHPTRLAVDPAGGHVWVSNNGDGTASEIDTRTATVVTVVALPDGSGGTKSYPNGVAVSPVAFTADGPAVWVVNDGPGTISQIDPTTGALVGASISVGGSHDHPIALTVSPDGNTLWVTNISVGTVAMISVPNVAMPPVLVNVFMAHGSTTVRWSPPVNTGGSAITGYTATAAPSGATCATTTGTSCVIPGLAAGSRNVITVTATNANGTSLGAVARSAH